MFLSLIPFVLTFHLINSDQTTFQAYYNPKTVDEIRYIIIALEQYIAGHYPHFKGKRDYLSTYNKNQLTDYTTQLVESYCRNFENIQNFNRNIKIYPPELTPDSIIENGESQFLFKWAINAEKFKRKSTQTSHLLGGLIDYAQYMTLPKLRSYIRNTLIDYPTLNSRSIFDREILNIKPYKESVFQYIQEAPIDIIRYWINNLEFYLTNVKHVKPAFGHEDGLKTDNPKSALQKNMYTLLKAHSELLEIEYFIHAIDYKNIKYNPMPLDDQSEKSIRGISLGCEEYNKKQKNLSKSFRALDQYYDKIPIDNLKAYSFSIIKEYPELNNFKLIDDLTQNSKRQNFGKVKDNVDSLSRKELITYILNARAVENKTEKFSEDLNDLFPLKDNQLREMLLNISKRNSKLQTQEQMVNAVELNNNSLSLWLEQMPQNILGEVGYNLTKQYTDKDSHSNFFYDTPEEIIRERIMTLSHTHNITSPIDIEKKIMNNSGPLYHGMYNYFKSINKETLFVWIKLFEKHHRQVRKLTSIIGGITNNQADKRYYIGKLFYYLEQYPEFKDPKKFDQFVGLDKVHEIVYNQTNLGKTALAFNRYHKRLSPNLQYSMNIFNYYPQIDKAEINFLYFYIFKIMAIYPELNLPHVFKIVNEMPNTSNITDYLLNIFGNKIYYSAVKIQNHHNALYDDKDTVNLRQFDDNRLKNYIQTKYLENEELQIDFGRLVLGQSDYLYWNYEEFFDRQTKKELVDFAERMQNYLKAETKQNFKEMEDDTIRDYLRSQMKQFEELHNATLFDKVINYVEADSIVKKEYIEMLEGLQRHTLMQFSLVFSHFNHLEHSTQIFPFIFLFLSSATKNELIRFICNGRYSHYSISTYNDLIVHTRQLFLDYGEQSILDLVEFR